MDSEVFIVLFPIAFAIWVLIKSVIYLYEEIKTKLSHRITEDENSNILVNQIAIFISPNIDICKLIVSYLNSIPTHFRLDISKPNHSVQYCNKNWRIIYHWEYPKCLGSPYTNYTNIFLQVTTSNIFLGHISVYYSKTAIEVLFNRTSNNYLANAFIALEENKHDVARKCAQKAWTHACLSY